MSRHSTWSPEPFQNTSNNNLQLQGHQHTNRSFKSDVWNESQNNNANLQRSFCFSNWKVWLTGLIVGVLLSGVGLAAVLTMWLYPVSFTNATSSPNSTSVIASTLTTTTTVLYLWNSTGLTVAGTGVTGSAANQLNYPFGLAVDSSNSLYIADWYNSRIQKYLSGASSGTTVAGQASGTSGNALNYLSACGGVAVDSSDTVYVADTGNNRGVSWTSGASTGTLIAGTTGSSGSANNQLDYPYGITLDSSGAVYISDFSNHRIMKYISGSTTGTLAAGGDGPGTNSSQLCSPLDIIYESSSNSLIIANYGCNNVVRWVLGANNWTLLAGSASGTSGSTSTLLHSPAGVAIDSLGNLYVADSGNNRIQFFLAGQSNGTTIAGVTGVSGSNSTLLSSPYGMAVDSQFNVYVADTFNYRVQKFEHY